MLNIIGATILSITPPTDLKPNAARTALLLLSSLREEKEGNHNGCPP
jgi:hypothetical protein